MSMYVCNCDTFKTIVFATNKQITVHNFQVDIFGECSARSCKRGETACEPNVAAIYKFYLSFENSFCSEYVTEKFYNYMAKDIVPVVLGIPIPTTTTGKPTRKDNVLLFLSALFQAVPTTATSHRPSPTLMRWSLHLPKIWQNI